jgi:hypothetical protein
MRRQCIAFGLFTAIIIAICLTNTYCEAVSADELIGTWQFAGVLGGYE